MHRTLRWARAGYAHYLRRETGLECALFPIVQGGMYAELRRACAGALLELNAPGYAVGGLSVGEPRELSLEMAAVTTALLPHDRPRYVMGVGMPEELAQYVACGVDMMDCVLPTRNARNGYLFTSQGKIVIKQNRYQEDDAPLDPACSCYTCRTFTRAYLRHLFQAGEILFSTLATLHNIHYYLDIMRRMREAILLGNFPEFLRSETGRGTEQPPTLAARVSGAEPTDII
jgi:queuine tRNA-ribosyltransferase